MRQGKNEDFFKQNIYIIIIIIIIMILLLSEHAKKRMAEHALTKEMVKEAIERGSKARQSNGLLATYTYFQVAYRIIKPGIYKIKTVMVKK